MEVSLLCEIAGVSSSGYYQWSKYADQPDRDDDDYLLIKELYDQGKGKYGWRTIKMKLKTNHGLVMNHKKIQRIKNKYRLFTKIRKINPSKALMKKTQEHRVFPNLLDRNFKQTTPDRIFGTDITYLPFNRRVAYLSAVKDLASREIVVWNMSNHLTMEIVLDTIENMKQSSIVKTLDNILIHSDQGFHYTNPEYIFRIKELNMVQSMSRKGNCIDNAPIESFFGHLKDDVDYQNCLTFDELKETVKQYIHYYNHERPQWNLKKMTPVEYRNHLLKSSA